MAIAKLVTTVRRKAMPKTKQKQTDSQPQACTKEHVEITENDLPLSCPPREDRLWDAHPRVYLPIEETGKETCPYCDTHYKLVK